MLNLRRSFGFAAALGAGVLLCAAESAKAQVYNVAYTAGGSWNTVYAQGFNTSLGAVPVPGISVGNTVDLSQFQFFTSGDTDSASNFKLVILNAMYPNLTGLTTSSSSVVGVSTNTIASSGAGPSNVDTPITFAFNNLALAYGSDYAAMFATIDGSGNITPVLVSALTANYTNTGVDTGSGVYHPVPNYGTDSQYQYTTTNFISGGYFSAFTYAGDADFNASLSTVPEPASLGICGLAAIGFLRRRPRNVTK